jgi:hypothetical protein
LVVLDERRLASPDLTPYDTCPIAYKARGAFENIHINQSIRSKKRSENPEILLGGLYFRALLLHSASMLTCSFIQGTSAWSSEEKMAFSQRCHVSQRCAAKPGCALFGNAAVKHFEKRNPSKLANS